MAEQKKREKGKHHSVNEMKAKKKMEKERVRRRQEARAGETDTIAVNIKKKHVCFAVLGEQ